jgi:hypothetical protein
MVRARCCTSASWRSGGRFDMIHVIETEDVGKDFAHLILREGLACRVVENGWQSVSIKACQILYFDKRVSQRG